MILLADSGGLDQTARMLEDAFPQAATRIHIIIILGAVRRNQLNMELEREQYGCVVWNVTGMKYR